MKMVRFKTLLIIVLLVAYGCSEPNLAIENLTEDDLTRQFELLKGQMRPIQDYDSSVLSQNKPMSIYSTGCVTTDQQIYYKRATSSHVKSVSPGQIKKIVKSDLGLVVVIKSGKYLAVYRYLNNVKFDEGDLVDKGQVVGQAQALEPFYFEVYKVGSGKLNPSEWVKV